MENAHEPIDFGDECSQNDENIPPIVYNHDVEDELPVVEDKYLRQRFLTEPNALNIESLRKYEDFMSLYCFDNKEDVVVQGIAYVKRGYIICKGYRKFKCKCSVGYKLVQNYNEKGANYEPRADGLSTAEDSAYTPTWRIDTTSTSNCFEHTSLCTFGRTNLDEFDLSCAKLLITAKDVSDCSHELTAYAHELKKANILMEEKLCSQLKMIICNKRAMDLNDPALAFSKFRVDGNAVVSLKKIISTVEGTSGRMKTMKDVFNFLKSSSEYDHTIHSKQCYDGLVQVGICVVSKYGIQQFQRYHTVMEIDSTFKKNNEEYPLVIIIGIDGDRKLFIIGFALIHDSSTESYSFVLDTLRNKLVNCNGVAVEPDVVFTDEEDSCINAIHKTYPNSRKFRCDWHLQKNIEQHTSYPKNKLLKEHGLKIRALFWSCKVQYTEQDYLLKFNALKDYIHSVDGTNCNDIIIAEFKKRMTSYFLQDLPKTACRWADYFRTAVFHIGIKSTQSCECVNGMLAKRGLNGTSSVGKMVQTLLEIFQKEKEDKKLLRMQSNFSDNNLLEERKLTNGSKKLFKDLLDYIKRGLTTVACNAQVIQMNESLMHRVIRWDINNNLNDASTVYTAVVHNNHGTSGEFDTTVTFQSGNNYTCSRCECAIGFGVVCRHYIAVMHSAALVHNIGLPYHISFVHRHWHKDSDEINVTVYGKDASAFLVLSSYHEDYKFIQFNPINSVTITENITDETGAEI